MITEIGHCPWISIIPLNLMEQTKENEILSLFRLYVKVTENAIQNYEAGKFLQLDALVGNYGCEVHAFNILTLAHSDNLKVECKNMRAFCQKISEWIQDRFGLLNNKKKLKDYVPLTQFYQRLGQEVKISAEMLYLIQSQFLSVIKEVIHDESKFEERDFEYFRTNINHLRRVTKLKCEDKLLHDIVSIAQASMSKSSILFMRAQLEKLVLAQEDEGLLVKKMLKDENLFDYSFGNRPKKTFSCAYYNTKALLLLVAELQAPLVVKKMTKAGEPIELFPFSSLGEFGEFKPVAALDADTPVVICQVYLPEGMSSEEWLNQIQLQGLGSMILASASQESQYVPNKPQLFPIPVKEAADEIHWQSEVKAKELQCVRGVTSIFDLDHFYCTTWQNRYDVFNQGVK